MSKSFWLLSAGITALATPAYAQEEPATATGAEAGAVQDDAGQPDIVITAQGRRQLLQDVPLAVQAVGGQQLQNSGANDIRQLNQLAPSLLVSSTGTEANGSARIRGVGTVGDNPGLESSVAVFIDGVYRSRSGMGLSDLGEIERIEVLRGPQGTLFGRNASAGLIHVITRRPEFEFGGSAELTYGNYNYIRGQIGITGPISEQLAFRIDGVYTRRDGFYDVVNAAAGTESEVNDRNRFFTRAQLLFEPSDAVSIRLIGDYAQRTESCCGATYVGLRETFDATPGVPGDFAVRQPGAGGSPDGNRIVDILTSLGGTFPSRGDPYRRDISVTPGTSYEGRTTDWGLSLQLDWDLGGANLTSITAYRDYDAETPGDIDYSNVDLLRRNDNGNAFRAFQTFSQEIRLQGSAFGGFLDWLVGGYYASEDLHVRDNQSFGAQYGPFAACRAIAAIAASPALRDPTAPGCLSAAGTATLTGALGAAAPLILGAPTGTLSPLGPGGLRYLSEVRNVGDIASNYFQDSNNWAVFTHNIFNITDTLNLTIGLRYTHESKDLTANFNNNNTFCARQQAYFAPYFTGGATPLPAAVQTIAGQLVTLTCAGNSSSSLNALNLSDSRDEGEWTGTAVLSWRPSSQLLLYGGYSRGYKAGGFNLDRSALGSAVFAPGDPRNTGLRGAPFGTTNLQFDPETVNAWEVGFKWTNRNFILNVAAFRQAFSSFQLNTFNGTVFLVQNINGCSNLIGGSGTDQDQIGGTNPAGSGGCAPDDVRSGVTSTGVEVEAAIYPHRDLQFTAGFTYVNTTYRADLVGRDTGAPLDPFLFLLPGDNMSNAPKYTATASATWTPQIGNGYSLLVYADTRLSGDYNTGSDLFPEKEQDSFAVVNARLGLRGPGRRWSVELWAQNLFDTNYQQVAFNTPLQGSNSVAHVTNYGEPNFGTANQLFSSYLAEPRTFGITGRFRF